MAENRSVIPGSERAPPPGSELGPEPPDARGEVSVYLKAAPARPAEAGAAQPFSGRAELRAEREDGLKDAMARVSAFAQAHGLNVAEAAPARRLVRLEGTVEALQTAFGAQLRTYEAQGRRFRGRTGSLTVPAEVVGDIEAVLGLDQRPAATPKSIRLARPHASSGFLPNAVARLYGFPEAEGQGQGQGQAAGAGECIALIELGGGFTAQDTAAAFKAMKLTAPKVEAVAVSGGKNAPGGDDGADGEVALDIQVAGGSAPGATIAVYFAANTDQGFVDAISQAAHDETRKPSVMSISWGSAESAWTQQAVSAMTSALQDAADLGVSVFAASGDGLATDGVKDGKAHVDFPASSPLVVGCGGTHLKTSGQRLTGETVWNSNGGGTGGGVSDLFDVPSYQAAAKIPVSVNGGRTGRGVPDVASDADPSTGYRVVVDGQTEVIGGTSAAAPLWAGLFAAINAAAGRPSGAPHAVLYAHPDALRDIVSGNNRSGAVGYAAGPGWDACTGLGSPQGAAVAALFTGGA